MENKEQQKKSDWSPINKNLKIYVDMVTWDAKTRKTKTETIATTKEEYEAYLKSLPVIDLDRFVRDYPKNFRKGKMGTLEEINGLNAKALFENDHVEKYTKEYFVKKGSEGGKKAWEGKNVKEILAKRLSTYRKRKSLRE